MRRFNREFGRDTGDRTRRRGWSFGSQGVFAMAGIFELKTTAAAKFHFVLKAGNGEIILQSQQYEAKSGAENGIESVRANAPFDERFERKAAKNDEPYFVLKAGNGLVIGQSETYSTVAAMEKGITSVKTNAPEAKFKDLTEAEGAK